METTYCLEEPDAIRRAPFRLLTGMILIYGIMRLRARLRSKVLAEHPGSLRFTIKDAAAHLGRCATFLNWRVYESVESTAALRRLSSTSRQRVTIGSG